MRRLSSWLKLPSLAIVTLAMASVAVPQSAHADDAKAEVEQLRARVVELRRELVMRDLEIQRLAEELAELRGRSSGDRVSGERVSGGRSQDSRAAQPGSAPSVPVEPVDDDVSISGLGGVEEFELEEPQRQEPEPPSLPASQAAPTGEPAPQQPPGAGGEELYDQGYALFHQQKYPESERAFKLFLTRYATSDLADNALFWIGESRWARGDFAAALESYTTTVEQYPSGNKVPDALLKAGRCLETLGQVSRAMRTYEEVVLRFAGSAAAITAEERLQALR